MELFWKIYGTALIIIPVLGIILGIILDWDELMAWGFLIDIASVLLLIIGYIIYAIWMV